MPDASFLRADLSDAVLVEAKAFRAKFVSTDLTGADLGKADLREADMTKANLSGALFNLHTVMPDGQNWHDALDLSVYTGRSQFSR